MRNPILYRKLLEYGFDEEHEVDPGYSFLEKVAKANNWTPEYTADVIIEYKRFMYLCIVYGKVAPSDPVDQIWHQHILYTKDYEIFCHHFAGRFIHHAPDRKKGGSNTAYDRLVELYQLEFEQVPPAIWNLQAIDYKRVDLTNNFLVPVDSVASAIKLFFLTLKTNVYVYFVHRFNDRRNLARSCKD